jgi:branched-chain amino acid transport system ATP-binding protein
MRKMPLLELANVEKRFGGLAAVDNVSVTVNEGEIFGLIGPNGAGKTTLFNCISGMSKQTRGNILYTGIDISKLKPNRRAKLGISRTFQITTLFKQYTTLQNVLMGFHLHAHISVLGILLNTAKMRNREKEIQSEAIDLLKFMNIESIKEELAMNLSHGHQRIVEMAIALAVKPKLLLLDEPLAGVSSDERGRISDIILQIKNKGVTILLVEHDMKAVMNLCDRIAVLNYGKKIAEGTPVEIQKNPDVMKAYLGEEGSDVF